MKQTIDLRALRKSLGLKQTDFAKKIGITQAYLSEIELYKKNISVQLQMTLTEIFGNDVCEKFAISVNDDGTPQITATITGNNNQIAGHDVNNADTSADTARLLQIIHSQSQQLDKAQAQLDKAQAQIDRLLSIIEKLSK